MRNLITVLSLILTTIPVHAGQFRYNYSLIPSNVPSTWQQTDSEYGPWENTGTPYNCANWSPSASSQGKGVVFQQTANDCSQNQERWVQDYEINRQTEARQKIGDRYTQTRIITASDTKEAVGVLENWLAISPSYTDWVDTNALYSCTSWSPNPAIYTETVNFTQSSTACKTDQERQRQEREQERYTKEIRNAGQPVVESQTLTGQAASRPYSVVLGGWTASGAPYDCSNWSPAVETVGKGVTFTQNATDCKLDQSRTRAESYKDHLSGTTVPVAKPNETRTLTSQGSSRQATGTLEDWMTTTPIYTAWVNTSVLNNCTNWSPDPVSKTSAGTFTQTATNCTTDQTRNRQDREKEQFTGEVRDKGAPVAENQTLQNQSAARNYTITLGSWTSSGAKYGCTNWSPAPSTVTIGQSFTQTATDCEQDQTRSRVETYVDHKSGQTVTAANKVEVQTLTGQSSTQTATGTKETWVATTSTYTAWVNSGAVSGCSAWTPDVSTVDNGTSFTQTRSCTQGQTRQRQDREVETTTGSIRNSGTAVTETQNVTVSQNQTAYGTKPTEVIPVITAFNVNQGSFSAGACGYKMTANWSGTDVANYTLATNNGTFGLGTATSYVASKYTGKGANITWTLTACSATGQCTSASRTVNLSSGGHCN